MSVKINAAMKELGRRDPALGRVLRRMTITVGRTPHRLPVTVHMLKGKVTVQRHWLSQTTVTVAYSLGFAAFARSKRPFYALIRAGGASIPRRRQLAEVATNLAARRVLDKAFGYRGNKRPFEPSPYEAVVQRVVTGSLGAECCDDTVCVYRALDSFKPSVRVEGNKFITQGSWLERLAA